MEVSPQSLPEGWFIKALEYHLQSIPRHRFTLDPNATD